MCVGAGFVYFAINERNLSGLIITLDDLYAQFYEFILSFY